MRVCTIVLLRGARCRVESIVVRRVPLWCDYYHKENSYVSTAIQGLHLAYVVKGDGSGPALSHRTVAGPPPVSFVDQQLVPWLYNSHRLVIPVHSVGTPLIARGRTLVGITCHVTPDTDHTRYLAIQISTYQVWYLVKDND